MNYDLIGAFDRHNYGDILFPWIHVAFLKECGISDEKIEFYSFTQADLRVIGGFKTKSLDRLPGPIKGKTRRRIVVGGEVLVVDWVAMASNSLPRLFKYPLLASRKVLGRSLSNNIVAKLYGGKQALPYVFASEPGCDTYYCSVGGTALAEAKHESQKKGVARALRSAQLVSVRDIKTRDVLAEEGLVTSLVPDVATLMSEFMTVEELRSLDPLGYCVTSTRFDPCGYFTVQVGIGYGAGSEDEISNQISELIRLTKKSVLLVPIGRASGHEDHIILRRIFERLKGAKPVAILESENIFHIMGVIALSEGYAGTSLHGAITAFAFCKPVCGLRGSKVKKLRAYIETWFPKNCATVVPDFKFAEDLCNTTKSHDTLIAASSHHKQCLSIRSFLSKIIGDVKNDRIS